MLRLNDERISKAESQIARMIVSAIKGDRSSPLFAEMAYLLRLNLDLLNKSPFFDIAVYGLARHWLAKYRQPTELYRGETRGESRRYEAEEIDTFREYLRRIECERYIPLRKEYPELELASAALYDERVVSVDTVWGAEFHTAMLKDAVSSHIAVFPGEGEIRIKSSSPLPMWRWEDAFGKKQVERRDTPTKCIRIPTLLQPKIGEPLDRGGMEIFLPYAGDYSICQKI